MLSVLQAKSKLPLEFVEDLYKNYNERIADKILKGMLEKRLTTLRVNTLKYNISQLMQYFDSINIDYDRVSWYEEALIINNAREDELQKLDIYKKGYIYIQSLSSMIPPIVLNPKEKDKVLDLTAAPGSKTTQISSIMKNNGYILANELDKIRFEKLKYNISLQGANIVEVINERGENIGEKYQNYFDKVLLDTPCSGEGRFEVIDKNTYKSWSTKLVQELTKIQKELFKSAVTALKQNGEMVYSTCTLNTKENEEILDWAIKNLNVELIDIELNIKDSSKAIKKGFDKQIEKAIRVLPNKLQEGFFVAKLKKL